MQKVSDECFESLVLGAVNPILVDFGAQWCQPCKHLEPILEELCVKWDLRISLVKVDIGEAPLTAVRCQILSLPTVLLFKEGKEILRLTGLQSKQKLVEKIAPFLEDKQ